MPGLVLSIYTYFVLSHLIPQLPYEMYRRRNWFHFVTKGTSSLGSCVSQTVFSFGAFCISTALMNGLRPVPGN